MATWRDVAARPSALPPRPRSFKVAALVCKRFRQLCLDPELLRIVQLAAVGERAVPRCRALLAFLQAHARHVRRLTVHACVSEARPSEAPEEQLGDPALRQELAQVLQQCWDVLGAAGAAQEVVLSAATPVANTAWLAGLASLRLLWVGTDDAALELPAGFSELRLREVGLRGSTVRLSDPRLSPTLERLHLAGSGAAGMLAEQVGRGPLGTTAPRARAQSSCCWGLAARAAPCWRLPRCRPTLAQRSPFLAAAPTDWAGGPGAAGHGAACRSPGGPDRAAWPQGPAAGRTGSARLLARPYAAEAAGERAQRGGGTSSGRAVAATAQTGTHRMPRKACRLPHTRAPPTPGSGMAAPPPLFLCRPQELHSTRELGEAELATVSRALASLTGLTTLVFGCFPLLSLPLEATVRPPGLQRLLFFTPLMPPDPGALRWETSNPRSCYLAHIRWLGLPYVVAAFSLPTLRRLAHLEYLGLVDTPVLGNPWADPPEDGAPSEAEEGAWQRFWDFCAEHPPLRALGLDADRAEEAELTMQLLDALLALARRRPRLHIRRTPPRPWEQQYDWCRSSVRARGEFFYLWVSGVGGVLSLSVCARRQGGGGGLPAARVVGPLQRSEPRGLASLARAGGGTCCATCCPGAQPPPGPPCGCASRRRWPTTRTCQPWSKPQACSRAACPGCPPPYVPEQPPCMAAALLPGDRHTSQQ